MDATRLSGHINGRSRRRATYLSDQVHQATGMVSGQLRVPVGEALARLRVYAALTDRSLVAVAVSIIDRRLALSSPVTVGLEGDVLWWDLGVDLWAPRRSRQYIKALLTGWGLAADHQYDAQYVASELVSNATEHAGGVMGVAVSRSGHELIKVAVADGSVEAPYLQSPNPLSRRGHGLQAVDAMAVSWGYNIHEFGKTVWVKIGRQD